MTTCKLLEGASEDLMEILLNILASSPPLHSLAELVQNGIDIGAQNITIKVCTKKAKKGRSATDSIIIEDDGTGFLESFEHYRKNIGNSIKKKVDEYVERTKRGESIGEFCIGMQGFRSMVSEIQVINITKEGVSPIDKNGKPIDDPDFPKMYKPRKMRMLKADRNVYIDEENEFHTERTFHGVTYILIGLTSHAQKTLTIKSIASYLSENKRAILLHNKNLKIKVTDGVKEIFVKPLKHRGEKVEYKIVLPNQEKDIRRRGFGNIKAELYYNNTPLSGSKIALTVGKEPIYSDICQRIPEFNRLPWNSGLVEGNIEYDRLTKAGTRQDVIKDDFWDAFIEMLYELEKQVKQKVEEIRKKYQSKKYKSLVRKLEDVFAQVRREVEFTAWFDRKNVSEIKKGPVEMLQAFPEKANVEAFSRRTFHVRAYDSEGNELTEIDDISFSWKVTGPLGKIKEHGNDAVFEAGSIVGTTQLLATATDKRTMKKLSCNIDIVVIHPIRPGRLFRVKAVPSFVTVPINRQKEIHAIAEDSNGNKISSAVKYYWEIIYDECNSSELNWYEGDSVIFTPGKKIGQVKIRLQAKQRSIIKEDFVIISVIEEEKRRTRKRRKSLGLPLPQDYNDPTECPIKHSYLTPDNKSLMYNTAHPDYKANEQPEKKRQRYIANLMAKELAFVECKETGQFKNFGETFLEILSKIDKYW